MRCFQSPMAVDSHYDSHLFITSQIYHLNLPFPPLVPSLHSPHIFINPLTSNHLPLCSPPNLSSILCPTHPKLNLYFFRGAPPHIPSPNHQSLPTTQPPSPIHTSQHTITPTHSNQPFLHYHHLSLYTTNQPITFHNYTTLVYT